MIVTQYSSSGSSTMRSALRLHMLRTTASTANSVSRTAVNELLLLLLERSTGRSSAANAVCSV
eukprot:12453-Heterococcus_DN1.PRE.5